MELSKKDIFKNDYSMNSIWSVNGVNITGENLNDESVDMISKKYKIENENNNENINSFVMEAKGKNYNIIYKISNSKITNKGVEFREPICSFIGTFITKDREILVLNGCGAIILGNRKTIFWKELIKEGNKIIDEYFWTEVKGLFLSGYVKEI